MVTLTGVGGTGKTRLAVEVATHLLPRFADGAWLAELAPVTQEEGVPHAVADVVGAMQLPDKTITDSLVAALKHRSALLVLDNCEHVLDAAAELAEAITTQCPEIRILATSREGLAVRGERVMRVASLGDTDGAKLFRDRARAAASEREMNPDTLARLSARLDGIPLAIELAAARCASMSPEEIEKRLDDRFRLLRSSRRGRLERHQTLRNAVAWSYELLNDVEQRVFDRLSAFAGGFTLEAAAAVAGGGDIEPADVEDAITALVDRSMVLASDTGEDGTRYRLLETLRQFGEERLIDKGAGVAVRARHVEWFVTFMRGAWEGLWSADDARWIRNVGREFENLRVAVYTAIDNNDGHAVGALLKPLPIWAQWSLRYEVGEWAEAALELEDEPPHARAVAVYLLAFGGRLDDATRLAPGLDRAKSADLDEECQRALARWSVAMNRRSSDNYDLLLRAAETVGRTGNRGWKATVTGMRVATAVIVGRMDEAKRLAVELLEDAENIGNVMALGLALFSMGRAYSDTDPELALRSFGRSRELNERHGLPLIVATAASEEALIIARVGEPDKGRVQLARALRSFITSGDLSQLWTSAHHLVYFLIRLGRMDDARAIWAGLGGRTAFAAPHHREELQERLGGHGQVELSDDDLIERIREILDDLEGDGSREQ